MHDQTLPLLGLYVDFLPLIFTENRILSFENALKRKIIFEHFPGQIMMYTVFVKLKIFSK